MRRLCTLIVLTLAALLTVASPAFAGEFKVALPQPMTPDGTGTSYVGEVTNVSVGLERWPSTDAASVEVRMPAALNPQSTTLEAGPSSDGSVTFTCGSWTPDGTDLVLTCTWNAHERLVGTFGTVSVKPTAPSGPTPYVVTASISGPGDTDPSNDRATLAMPVAERSGGQGTAPPPEANRSETAEPVSGKVYVRRRGSKRFVRLTGERSIPDGSEIDARNGTVRLTVAAGEAGGVRIALVKHGRFIVDQNADAEPLTRLILSERLAGCRRSKSDSARAGAAARKKRGRRRRRAKQRRLWVKENGGRWQTRGSYASATVEGTEWTLTDFCTRTRVEVAEGTVRVRDSARRRTVTVGPGSSYTT